MLRKARRPSRTTTNGTTSSSPHVPSQIWAAVCRSPPASLHDKENEERQPAQDRERDQAEYAGKAEEQPCRPAPRMALVPTPVASGRAPPRRRPAAGTMPLRSAPVRSTPMRFSLRCRLGSRLRIRLRFRLWFGPEIWRRSLRFGLGSALHVRPRRQTCSPRQRRSARSAARLGLVRACAAGS